MTQDSKIKNPTDTFASVGRQKSRRGFTLIELLIAVVISATLFVLVSQIIVSLFRSDTRSKHSQTLEQTKNDIKTELTNTVRWANNVSFSDSRLVLDGDVYELANGRFTKNGVPLSHKDIEVYDFRVVKHTPVIDATTVGAGFGLTGIYYDNDNFTGASYEQIDSVIDIDWGSGSPIEGIEPDTFSVKWTGQIESLEAGDYPFKIDSNDGARVWIDDELVLDAWNTGSDTGSKDMLTDKRYNILIEYREGLEDANIDLQWSLPGGSYEVIPSKQLYPNSLSTSLEISMELVHRNDPALRNSFRTILTPRSGTVIGGIINDIPTPTDFPLPTNEPTPTPQACLEGIDEVSGWVQCNGWNPNLPGYNPNYNPDGCRTRALIRARGDNENHENPSRTDFYALGLPLPPSGSKFSPQGGNDDQWFFWGQNRPAGREFIGVGTSCGIGPSHCVGRSCDPINPGR